MMHYKCCVFPGLVSSSLIFSNLGPFHAVKWHSLRHAYVPGYRLAPNFRHPLFVIISHSDWAGFRISGIWNEAGTSYKVGSTSAVSRWETHGLQRFQSHLPGGAGSYTSSVCFLQQTGLSVAYSSSIAYATSYLQGAILQSSQININDSWFSGLFTNLKENSSQKTPVKARTMGREKFPNHFISRFFKINNVWF